jgi:hypothetical protein
VLLRDNVLGYVAFLAPLLLVLYLAASWRRYAIREIDAAGGYDAWKKLHGPVAPR